MLFAHGKPLSCGEAVDLPLDGEDRIHALHRLERERGDDGQPCRALAAIGEHEELASGMRPARRLNQRSWPSLGRIEPAEPGIGVRLQDAGIAAQVMLGMIAGPVAGVIEHRRRRILPADRPVVAHINPARPVMVLPLASTGTVVSSPCTRSPAST